MASFVDFLNTPKGMGLLSGVASYAMNARRGTPWNNFGRGVAGGLLGYQTATTEQKAEMEKQRKKDAIAKLFADAQQQAQPGMPARQAIPAQYKAGDRTFDNLQDAEKYVYAFDPAQEAGMALNNEFGGSQNLPLITDFGQYATAPFVAPNLVPKMGIEILPGVEGHPGQEARAGGFDRDRLLMGMMQDPDAGFQDVALKAFLEQKTNTGDSPFGKIMPADYTPDSLEQFAKTGKYSALQPTRSSGAGFGNVNPGQFTPDSLAVYAQTQNYGDLVPLRAPVKINMGNEEILVDPVTKNVLGRYPKQLAPQDLPATKAAQTRATGEAEIDVKRQSEAPKIQSKISSQGAKYKQLEQTIDKAIKDSGFWSTGIMAQMTSGIGSSPAKNLAATLETIKANMGFDELQEMRDNSPTGGALGQVAVQEIQFLQSVIASLDQAQSNDQLKENLRKIKAAKKASNERIRKAYQETYGNGMQNNKPPIDKLW